MKVLFVDQFGKTSGRDTLALAELVNGGDIQMTVYLADTTEIPADRSYSVRIRKGFHGAYEGNALHKAVSYLRALGELRRYIIENRFDIVHLQWFSLPWLEWSYVSSLKKYAGIVVTVHDVVPFDNRPLEMQSLDRIYRRADRLLLHTERAREEFARLYGAKTPVTVITQGFCYKPDYVRLDRAEARGRLGVPEDAVVFLYYGTIRASKGLDTLMRAVLQAQQRNRSIYLLAAGAFHKVDEELYRSLADQVTRAGGRVDFGFVPFALEQYYFSAADVLVLPYTEGTQSGVAQLGLMYELPLIASDIYCMDDVARPGENALRFPAGDAAALADCIGVLAEDGALRASFARASGSIGEYDFSLENKARLVREAYRETAGARLAMEAAG